MTGALIFRSFAEDPGDPGDVARTTHHRSPDGGFIKLTSAAVCQVANRNLKNKPSISDNFSVVLRHFLTRLFYIYEQ